MRCLRWLLVLLVLASTQVTAQDDNTNAGMCPITPKLGDKPIRHYSLAGTVGRRPVRAYIERDGNVAIAVFYYTDSIWTPVLLGGGWKNGIVEVTEKEIDEDNPKATGRLTGRLTPAGFSGTWSPSGSGPSLPMHLHLTPPLSCNGSGPWKRLDDPRLPVTFSYPASWHISKHGHSFGQHEDDLTLTCPDPAAMFYAEGLTVATGASRDIAEEGFHLTGGKWIFDHAAACNAENNNPPGCADAPVIRRGPLTILDGDNIEWRNYCAQGGYVALGEGHLRMLILGDRWIEFSGRGDDGEIALRIVTTVKIR